VKNLVEKAAISSERKKDGRCLNEDGKEAGEA
jgi:hypothetical protein